MSFSLSRGTQRRVGYPTIIKPKKPRRRLVRGLRLLLQLGAVGQPVERRGLAGSFKGVENVLDGHPVAEIWIDKTRLNPAVTANDKCRRNRKHPGISALVIRQNDSIGPKQL